MERKEVFLSVDIEADGRIPGKSSMLSFGCALLSIDKELLGTFSRNLHQLPDATPDPATMEWWRRQPKAWVASRLDCVGPESAMRDFIRWSRDMRKQHGRQTFMSLPGSYDFMWLYWYCCAFAEKPDFGFAALCLKSYAMAMLKSDFRQSAKRHYPRDWFDSLPHTHVSLDDAIETGCLGINMIRHSRGLPAVAGYIDKRPT